MRTIRFELPEPTILLNKWQRMHWSARKRHAQQLAWQVRAALGVMIKAPLERCDIQIERHSVGLPDWDGLYGGLKPLLDCLVVCSPRNPHGLGVIVDDSPKVVRALWARPVKCTQAEQRTVVTIREVA